MNRSLRLSQILAKPSLPGPQQRLRLAAPSFRAPASSSGSHAARHRWLHRLHRFPLPDGPPQVLQPVFQFRDFLLHLAPHGLFRLRRQPVSARGQQRRQRLCLPRNSGEDIEVLDPELAVRETAKPIALKTDRQVKKVWEVVRQCLAEGQTQAWTICIATASAHKYSTGAVLAMRPPGLQAEVLSGDYIKKPDTVVVEIWRDALRFYVCMTRARDQVYMLYEGAPSPFLRQMEDRIVWLEEAVMQDYQPGSAAPLAAPAARRMKFTHVLAQKGLQPHGSFAEHLSSESLAIVHLYYNAKVDESK